MHKSFVTTAHPPTGKGGDCGISAFRPCYKPHTQGANWGFKTLLFGLTLEIENYPGVRILMHKNLVIPPALRIHSTSNCSALKPGYPPPFTVGMCEKGGG